MPTIDFSYDARPKKLRKNEMTARHSQPKCKEIRILRKQRYNTDNAFSRNFNDTTVEPRQHISMQFTLWQTIYDAIYFRNINEHERKYRQISPLTFDITFLIVLPQPEKKDKAVKKTSSTLASVHDDVNGNIIPKFFIPMTTFLPYVLIKLYANFLEHIIHESKLFPPKHFLQTKLFSDRNRNARDSAKQVKLNSTSTYEDIA